MNRRGFLSSILALGAIGAVPALAKPNEPWTVPGAVVADQCFVLDGPLVPAPGVKIYNCVFSVPGGDVPAILIPPGVYRIDQKVWIGNCTFIGRGRA